jgi:hypothetical protein
MVVQCIIYSVIRFLALRLYLCKTMHLYMQYINKIVGLCKIAKKATGK